jgi:hypothetical protein
MKNLKSNLKKQKGFLTNSIRKNDDTDDASIVSPCAKNAKVTTPSQDNGDLLSSVALPTPSVQSVPSVTPEKKDDIEVTKTKSCFVQMPPRGMVGVSSTMLQLCATISGQIYQDKRISTRDQFQSLLLECVTPDVYRNDFFMIYVSGSITNIAHIQR